MSQFVLGLDVGYSSVKMAHGSGRHPAILNLSVGAAPLEALTMKLDGSDARNLGGGYEVLVNGASWVGGADPTVITNYTPVLHDGYTASNEYLALFYAALLACNTPRIGCLVVGLPVSHYADPSKQEALRSLLTGLHTVRHSNSVLVDRVKVVPQPLGAYVEMMAALQLSETPIPKDSTTLVVDPGHFSFDWCVVRGGLQKDGSGSTAFSGAKILEETVKIMRLKDNKVVDPEKLINAVRERRSSVQVGGSMLDISGPLREAAGKVMPNNISAMKNSLRSIEAVSGIDAVVVAGGASEWCIDAIRKTWPDAIIHTTPNPVESNARGFWLLGKNEVSSNS